MSDDRIMSGKICPYCEKETVYVDSSIVYGKSFGNIYYCEDCQAWVGVHKGTDKALGRLANGELREWKVKAHSLLDKLWKKKMEQGFSKKVARKKAYLWLSDNLGTDIKRTHIGMFDVDQCKKVVELCTIYFK